MAPAAYTSIAANEAEKHCDIKLIDAKFFGASGKMYLAGTESEIMAAAKKVGQAVAEAARAKGIKTVVFDRNGYLYHGRIKALAEAAREAGLEF